jgi:hypothetical protein
MTDTDMQEFVKNHPKLLGVLFGLALMSSQVGGAAAAAVGAVSGP